MMKLIAFLVTLLAVARCTAPSDPIVRSAASVASAPPMTRAALLATAGGAGFFIAP